MRLLSHIPLVVCLASLTISGCDRRPADAPAPSALGLAAVRIQLNWVPEPEFGGIYAAEIIGAYTKYGLKVEILKGGPDVPAVQMVASNKVEFGVASADEVIALRDKGGDLVGLFATYQTSPQGIMCHDSLGVRSIEDLLKKDGLTLAVQPGLAYVKWFGKQYGLDRVKQVPYQGGIGQFMSDSNVAQQCFVISEPLAARRAGAEPRVFLIADTGFNPYTAVIVTSEKTLAAQPRMVAGFVAALTEGWRAYLDDPDPANAVMQPLNPSMDLETFREAAMVQKPLIENEQTLAHGLGTMNSQRWEQLARQLVELKVIDAVPRVEDCFRDPATLLP